MTERNRMEKRPRGGRSDFFDWQAAKPRKNPHGVHVGVFALRRSHADRGVALQELDGVEAFLHGVREVPELQIYVEVDEVLAVRMLDDGIGMRRTPSLGRDARYDGRV